MENFEMNNQEMENLNTQETQEQVFTPEFEMDIPAPTQVMEPVVPEVQKRRFDTKTFAEGAAAGGATVYLLGKLVGKTKELIKKKQSEPKGPWAIRSPFYRKPVENQVNAPAPDTAAVAENPTPEVQNNS